MTPMGEPVKNKDLIVEILSKIEQKKYVKFVKVAAHTGDKFNTIVDHFASGLTKKMVEDPSYPDKEHIH
jgi:ribonuclease HI